MKKIFLSLTMIAASLSFAQKKEIANAVKAAEQGDVNATASEVSKAEAIFGDKIYLLEPSLQEQYYYAKGLGLVKAGKIAEGAEVLSKITDLGKSTIYSGKDNDKNKVYFVGKEQADKLGAGISLKEEKYTPSLASKLGSQLNTSYQATNKKAYDLYQAKDFAGAAELFEEAYFLSKAAGAENQNLLYSSAVAYAQGNKKSESSKIFDKLIDINFNGIETVYTAKNKKTNTVDNLDKSTFDLYKKMGASSDYTDFKEEKTASKEEEIFDIQSALLMELEKYDQAIVVAQQGLKKFPNNAKLSNTLGLAYYKAGKTDEFVNSLKSQIAKNPTDSVAYYNLGVIYSKDPSKQQDAEDAFSKSISIDPTNKSSYTNMVYLIMGDDSKTIDEFNALRKAKKIDEANKVMEKRRARFAKAIPYAEKAYALDPKDADMVSLLKGFYNATQNTAKFNEFKAKEAELKK
ncbi:tetratricopeptide repeat protein [Soonwooa sp.]|uniref:tetratricopeptide repeat protein n=1 Tax=Soonwooa sp. TaxID=1938592 RepID=UPI0028AF4891|nr:tetratricopeptide repeat protein [Soonwooa sp.]